MRKYRANAAALAASHLQDVIESRPTTVATNDNPRICFDNAGSCAREGNHVGAFRWYHLGQIWLEWRP
jgi:hypothetical protein